jgi:quinolinate synthase
MENTLDIAINNMPVKGFLDLKEFAIPTGDDLVKAILDLKRKKCRDSGALLSAGSDSGYR